MLRRGFEVIVYGSEIDIARLSHYRNLMAQVESVRLEYSKLNELIKNVCDIYTKPETHAKLMANIAELRRLIRVHTRGAPVTEAFDAIQTSQLYEESHTSQLYNANDQLLKRAYRKVVSLVHLDKQGGDGDRTLFQAVNTAYKQRNLVFLTDLYFKLTKLNDFRWQQTEGISYALQELERPKVSLQALKHNPLYAIARLHLVGRVAQCSESMLIYLRQQEYVLSQELNSILTGGCNGNSKKGSIEGAGKENDGEHEGSTRKQEGKVS